MKDNLTLMNQDEIDALIRLLLDKANNTAIGGVLPQSEIDRLVMIMKRTQGFDESSTEPFYKESEVGLKATVVLDDKSNVNEGAEQLRLCMEVKEAENHIELYCENIDNGKRYSLTPGMFDGSRFIIDDVSTWGAFISPIDFDRLSYSLRVKYTEKTFKEVCTRFAYILYGDGSRNLPNMYLPGTRSLLAHITI